MYFEEIQRCTGLELHLQKDKAIFVLKRGLPLGNLKVYGTLFKGHLGGDQGQQRPWPSQPS